MKISHRLSVAASAVAVTAVLSYTSLQAAHHQSGVGEYSTRVQESRLFSESDGGTTLRCDLFFTSADGKTAVAEKGSQVTQQVPPFVWQYSGLLPISDYIKTVAIHSAATHHKIERWQDVQHTFYNGLKAEGVEDMDAKIAFAGAYAFAPRWPLVELVEITDELKMPDTRLYSVAATGPAQKGLGIDDYRALSRDIMDNPQDVTLSDIRGIVDAADAGEGNYEKSGFFAKLTKKIKGVLERQPQSKISEDWVVLPDGSAVLAKVDKLAQES